MPDRYYYQLVKKPANQALQEQREKTFTKFAQEQRKPDPAQEKEIYEMTQRAIEKALDDLLKPLK